MFSPLPKTIFSFSDTFILSSANAFKLDHPTIMSFGKEFNLYQVSILLCDKDLILNQETKKKAFPDNKINVTAKLKFVFGR